MASLVLSGDTSGSITVSAPAVAGSTTQTLVDVTGTLAPIVSGTAVTCAGQTSIDFTGIPSWVKRITVMMDGVSTSGTSQVIIRLGDAGGIEITGYNSGTSYGVSAGQFASSTDSFVIEPTAVALAAALRYGQFTFSKLTGNTWVADGSNYNTSGARSMEMAGAKTLSDTLTQVRITTANGTDTFDTTPSAGTINILYE